MLEIVAFGYDDNNHEGGKLTLLTPRLWSQSYVA